MRPSQRQFNELLTVRLTRHFTRHAEGSVLIEMGDTRVLCTASVEESVPGFLRGRGQGWVTGSGQWRVRRPTPGCPRGWPGGAPVASRVGISDDRGLARVDVRDVGPAGDGYPASRGL